MSKNFYKQNRKLFKDNTKSDSKLTNILQKNILKLLRDDFQYLEDFPDILISEEACQTNILQLVSTIHSIGSRIENEIDGNLLLLTEQKAKSYLFEFLDKAEHIYEILFRRRNAMDPSKPENVNSNIGIFSNELKNRKDIISAIQFLSIVQVRGIQEIIALLHKKLSYYDIEKKIDTNPKLKWQGKPAHFAFIIATLASNGFIDTPKKKDGEINFRQFALLAKNSFNVDITPGSLEKYLNLDSEKGQEPSRAFGNLLKIPNIIEVS